MTAWPQFDSGSLPVGRLDEEITSAIASGGCVITAEPGAGKTSLVPLMAARSTQGTVILCEPRRMAARSSARRLAQLTHSRLGQEVGLAMRGESKRSTATRLLVMTEGVLLQMISNDPELPGVGAIIFDEFHERSLNADLGLAMALESRSVLRSDLSIVVMSATIDAAPIAELLGGAPIVTAPGRTFEIEDIWSQRPDRRTWSGHVADLTEEARRLCSGSILVFAPGRREIADLVGRLASRGIGAVPLHGGTPVAEQARIMDPESDSQVIVASAVAETSITIPGIEAVVDGGLARFGVFDQTTGLGRLETGFATRFATEQRRGRAGRVGPGICLRAWSKAEHAHLDQAPVPEILGGDPLELGYRLAQWGDPMAKSLPFLDPPPAHRLMAAQERLSDLNLVGPDGTLTDAGRQVSRFGVGPRVGALLVGDQRPTDAVIDAAAVLSLDQFAQADDFEAEAQRLDHLARQEAKRLRRHLPSGKSSTLGLAATLAARWPDRLALRRPNSETRYLLATGKEVRLRPRSPLTGSEALVVVDADGSATSGYIKRAVPLTRDSLIEAVGTRATISESVSWDQNSHKIRSLTTTGYGALVFASSPSRQPDPGRVAEALLGAIVDSELELLTWSDAARRLQERLNWLHEQDSSWPDCSAAALLADLSDWLDVTGLDSARDLGHIDMGKALLNRLDWRQRADLDELAPTSLATISHTGRGANNIKGAHQVKVSYDTGEPVWRVRLQWLLGMDRHPLVGPNRSPILIELLSPASRPIQLTRDLPGFWRGSYSEVRKDLRGRYPKHDWPEAPLDY